MAQAVRHALRRRSGGAAGGLWRRWHDDARPGPPACILSATAQPLAPQLCSGPEYPLQAFSLLAAFLPGRSAAARPACLAIGPEGEGPRAGEVLRRAGFAVRELALRRQPGGALQGSRRRCCLRELEEQPGGQQERRRFDVVCFADTMHLVDTRRALQAGPPHAADQASPQRICMATHARFGGCPQAASRHLVPTGLLLCLWTDRDLASRFVLETEQLLEGTVPGFCRYACQRDPSEWGPRLQLGGLFRLVDYSCIPHSISTSPSALLDSLASSGALHSALGSTRRRAFHARLQRLMDAHFGAGAQRIQLPLHTKAYVLVKVPGGRVPADGRGRPGPPVGGGLEPERVCLFCGSPVEEE